ncbi:SIMPL domain-containing protein [Sphingomonas sp. AP4-R1]|uniref:SIMPL domain-containing protein n=1 Tax=Sphingomonas sp. AP4-R1 TaxID=2735134 RepID=UPI001493C48E|nr:SIMPL domain-containing protein [Sphingomonas sp. AP4-R1]QJU57565.1 SIMPL domain-containing protein [Sphingomonas sp. AP4-R1]
MRATLIACLGLALPAAAAAQAAEDPQPRIIVSGAGTASTAPDRVGIGYGVHGEGATSDEAVSAMVAKRKAIDGGLAGFAARPQARASQVTIVEVRGRDCNRNTYSNPRLSTGECAIIGYTADLTMDLQTDAVKEAGTIVGLIGRLGGTNPRIERFFLASDADARKRATAEALADAKRQAEAIAAGTDVRLGRLLSASNTGYNGMPAYDEIRLSAHAVSAPPPPPPPPPIPVDLTPRPIETQVRVQVVYAIAP